MMSKIRPPSFWLASLVFMALIIPVTAGAQSNSVRDEWLANYKHFGAAAAVTFPYQEFGDSYNTGYGLHGMVDFPLITFLNFIADVGWNNFPGENGGESADIFNFAGGAKIAIGVFFMGGEVGYFTDVDEVSWIPSIGLRFSRFEFAVRLKAVGSGSWTTLRFGYYF